MKMTLTSFAVSLATLCGCTATVVNQQGGASGTARPAGGTKAPTAPKTKVDTSNLKSKGGETPPASATATGKQSKPTVHGVVIPSVDTEVYTFQDDWNLDGTLDTMFWSHVPGGSTFMWATGSIQCEDGSADASTGFVMEVKADGTGAYMYAADGCGWTNFYGCDLSATGAETTCGACAMDNAAIVCAAAKQ
jgi:uncharacterized protein YdeI (BOF family)